MVKKYSKEEIELFEKLRLNRTHDVETFKKRAHRQYMDGIINKYSESAHFIYELLQNADDSEATKVEIIVADSYMIFKHNGKQRFTLTDVDDEEDETKVQGDINAITGTGFSTKDGNGAENKIGKFGIGFKAVFQYTDEPYIYDEPYCFKLVDKIVPHLLYEDHPLRGKNETMFYLPFNNSSDAYNKIIGRLTTMTNPILFLHNIEDISWKIEGQDHKTTFYKHVESSFTDKLFPDIRCEQLLCGSSQSEQRVWHFSRIVPIEGVTQSISVIYYLDTEGGIDTEIRPPIYCFFPLKIKFDLCFAAHAPFQLIDSRQNIKEDSETNITLQNALISLAADALVCLRDIGLSNNIFLINENLSSILPSKDITRPSDGLIDDFRQFETVVVKYELILSVGLKYIPISNAWYCESPELEDLIKSKGLNQLIQLEDNNDFVFVGKDRKSINVTLLNDIGMNVMTPDLFAELFDDSFIQKQDIGWADKFYSYLQNRGRNLWNKKGVVKPLKSYYSNNNLRYKSIIYTSTGIWATPFIYNDDNPKAFLPKADMSDGTQNEHYIFVNSELAYKHKAFFSELGLREPDQMDFVRNEILPKYSRSEGISEEVLRKDFQILLKTYNDAGDGMKAELRNILSESYKLMGYDLSEKEDAALHDISDLCDDSEDMKEFYPHGRFFSYEYYRNLDQTVSDDNIRRFVKAIGVKMHPVSIRKIEEWWNFSWGLRESSYSEVSSAKTPFDCEDYNVTSLPNAWDWERLTPKQSRLVWSFLCDIPHTELQKYMNSHCTAKKKYFTQYGFQQFNSTSSLLYCLNNAKWIFDSDGNRFCPEDITTGQFHTFGYAECPFLTRRMHFKVDKTIAEIPTSDLPLSKEEIEQNERNDFCKKIEETGFSREEVLLILQEKQLKKELNKKKKAQQLDESMNRGEPVEEDFSNYRFEKPSDGLQPSDYGGVSDRDKQRDVVNCHEPNDDTWRDKLLQKQEEINKRELEREALRQGLDDVEEFTYEWFLRRLKLECLTANEYQKERHDKSLSITFSQAEPHLLNNIVIFKKPSKIIPLWLESVDSFSITLQFSNHDDVKQTFSLASVKDYSLRVKVNNADAVLLSDLNWSCFTRASIEFNTPVDLVSTWYSAFESLELASDYNMQKELRDNISFIFGPPGTGKTTYLSRNIISPLMHQDQQRCKILVLTPTNKACDVLTCQLLDDNPEDTSRIGRFVTTSDDTLDQGGYVCDRKSSIYKYDRCCLVSTTTRLAFDFFEDYEGRTFLKDIDWDVIVFDESSMIHLPEMVYAIYKFFEKRIIIAGDPMQIPPVDAAEIWNGRNIYTMVKLTQFDHPQTYPIQFDITNLKKQWRAIEPIGGLFSHYAYGGILKHDRTISDQLSLNIAELPIKPITFVPFNVDDFDSLYGVKKLNDSNVHLYSALLTIEFTRFLAKKYVENNPDKELSIGIVCPYSPQAHIIQKLVDQCSDIPLSVKITTGTVHSFQGGQCNVVIGVMNPPKGLKYGASNAHVNNKNIVNVAISRAMDYLFLFIPNKSCSGYSNLREINQLGVIAQTLYPEHTTVFGAEQLEQIVFGKGQKYLDAHTFVTSHQLANVFSPTKYRYEIRIDDNAIDIQVGDFEEE